MCNKMTTSTKSLFLGFICGISGFSFAQNTLGVAIRDKTTNTDTTMPCKEILVDPTGHTYGTNTLTYRRKRMFGRLRGHAHEKIFRFKYKRKFVDVKTKKIPKESDIKDSDGNPYFLAYGGRCETEASTVFEGNGTFSLKLFVHPNVAGSDGVFTLATTTEKLFSKKTEWDVFVANIRYGIKDQADKIDNTPVVKFGNPNEAVSISLSHFLGKWITLKMVKVDDECSLTATDAEGTSLPFYPNNFREDKIRAKHVSCKSGNGKPLFNAANKVIADGDNQLSINARADSLNKKHIDHDSYIDITDVKWVKAD